MNNKNNKYYGLPNRSISGYLNHWLPIIPHLLITYSLVSTFFNLYCLGNSVSSNIIFYKFHYKICNFDKYLTQHADRCFSVIKVNV